MNRPSFAIRVGDTHFYGERPFESSLGLVNNDYSPKVAARAVNIYNKLFDIFILVLFIALLLTAVSAIVF